MTTATQALCACHGAPVADGATLCPTGTDGLTALLQRLTADVARGDREPTRRPDGTIAPGQAGRGASTVWDTPSGEISNLPRALDEQAAKLAVRKGLVIGRTPMAEAPLPLDLRAVDAAGQIRLTVGRLAADLSGHPMPLDGHWSVPDVAAWLVGMVETIRQREDAHDVLKGLEKAVGRAERHVDSPPERKYLGVCGVTPEADPEAPGAPVEAIPCAGQVFARDGQLRGRCNACGASHDVEERRAQLEAKLRGCRLTAADMEKVLGEIGWPTKRNTITVWAGRGHFTADGAGRYLVDDVLAMAQKAAIRRRKAS